MNKWVGFRSLVWREIVRFFSVFSQTIFPPIVSSFLFIFIFGFSLGARIDQVQGVSYLTFLIPGLIMMYAIEGSYTNASSSLFISRWANNIEELLVTPLSYFEMVLAFLIGGLARCFVTCGGVYLVSLLFVHPEVAHPFIILFFLLAVSLIFSCAGLIIGLFAEEFEHLTIASTFVITPLIYFGGVFHSISMMPEMLRWLTLFNPMFYMINGMRYGMLGTADTSLGLCVLVVVSLFAGLFSYTVYLFRIGFKLRK